MPGRLKKEIERLEAEEIATGIRVQQEAERLKRELSTKIDKRFFENLSPFLKYLQQIGIVDEVVNLIEGVGTRHKPEVFKLFTVGSYKTLKRYRDSYMAPTPGSREQLDNVLSLPESWDYSSWRIVDKLIFDALRYFDPIGSKPLLSPKTVSWEEESLSTVDCVGFRVTVGTKCVDVGLSNMPISMQVTSAVDFLAVRDPNTLQFIPQVRWASQEVNSAFRTSLLRKESHPVHNIDWDDQEARRHYFDNVRDKHSGHLIWFVHNMDIKNPSEIREVVNKAYLNSIGLGEKR